MPPYYAELCCRSSFSFLQGASQPEELVQRAAVLDYAALAITDECSLAGVVRAHLTAKSCGLKLIVGSEIRLTEGPRLVLLATDRTGYGNLSELISLGRRQAEKGSYHLSLADLEQGLPGCLAIWLSEAGQGGEPDFPPDETDGAPSSLDPRLTLLDYLSPRFPQALWIGVNLVRGDDDAGHLTSLADLSRTSGLPLVAVGDVCLHVRSRKRLHDVMTAIRLGRPVAECGRALLPNGERHLRSLGRLAAIYPDDLLQESLKIAERCRFSLEELRYEYPEEIVPAGATPASHLRQLTEQGLIWRYPGGVPEAVRGQIEHELDLIHDLAYEPYFLTVHDVVRFARSRHILCQGRGSAANSAVCFALGITEVDPARSSLLFERFLSRERHEPPDIDVDFEHQRREEVMQYIYAKYGRERAALAGALITYRPRSALRDVGKALGLSLDQVDRLAKSMSWWDGRQIKPERLAEAGFDPENPVIRLVAELAFELIGFPRHLSQHVGGFVIARDRLTRLVPVENAAMAERTVIQWDKDDLDALGLLKVDILALGMLSALRRCLDLVNAWRGTRLSLAEIPSEVPQVYDMLGRADSIGVFQVESRAQMSMLPRLKPRTFYDLVVQVAIVRPGPIQGGMVHPYLRRRQGLEPVDYPSPAVKTVLERTLGIPIFQEQVMQLAMVAAGFTPGEADQLRRAMAAWKRKGGLDKFHDKLLSGMLARGYHADYAERLFRQIQGFGEYGFPESHAASFALLVYVSAWFKCFEPAAFACALLNSLPMGFYSPSQLIQDAQAHGVQVLPVEVGLSDWECGLEEVHPSPDRTQRQPALRLGLNRVKGLGREAAERIVAARGQGGFVDVMDLAQRARLDQGELSALAQADALAGLAGHRRLALWQTLGAEDAGPLFAGHSFKERQPDLFAPTEGENVVADYASLGLTLRSHPLALLRPRLTDLGLITAAQVRAGQPGQIVRTAGIVTCRQRPGTASGVTFVTLEDETGMINVVVWRDLAERFRKELLSARLMVVYGQLEKDGPAGEVIHLIAGRLVDRSELLGRLETESRDFH